MARTLTPQEELEALKASLVKNYGSGAMHRADESLPFNRIPFFEPQLNYATQGGLPFGRFASFSGAPNSGKSRVALELVAQAQQLPASAEVYLIPRIAYHSTLIDDTSLDDDRRLKHQIIAENLDRELSWLRNEFPNGADAIFYNAEMQFDPVFAEELGVDLSRLLIRETTTIEEIVQTMGDFYAHVPIHIVDSTTNCSSLVSQAQKLGGSTHGREALQWKECLKRSMPFWDRNRNIAILIHQMSTNQKTTGQQSTATNYMGFMNRMSLRFDHGRFLWYKDGVLLPDKPTGADESSMVGRAEADGREVFVKVEKCVTGDTEVHTINGIELARDLSGREVLTLSEGGIYRSARWSSHGECEIYRVTLESGDTMFATANHDWIIGLRHHGVRRRIKTPDLLGHTIPIQPIRVFVYNEDEYSEGVRHGMTYGDGCVYQSKSMLIPRARLDQFVDVDKEVMVRFFDGTRDVKHASTSLMALRASKLPAEWKELPSVDNSQSYLRGFIAGYLQADGYFGPRGHTVVYSSRKDELDNVRLISQHAGLATGKILMRVEAGAIQYCKVSKNTIRANGPQWLLNFGKESFFNGNTLDDHLVLKSTHKANLIKSGPPKIGLYAKVVAVEATECREEVFCCEEPVTNSWVMGNGVLTGNSTAGRPGRVAGLQWSYPQEEFVWVHELAASALYYGLARKSGSWFSIVGEDQNIGQGLKSLYHRLIEDAELRAQVMVRLLDFVSQK
jgi:RecA/RadA recombinase